MAVDANLQYLVELFSKIFPFPSAAMKGEGIGYLQTFLLGFVRQTLLSLALIKRLWMILYIQFNSMFLN